MSAHAFATRPYTPRGFRPAVERVLLTALSLAAVALWALVLPLELVLA
jgi:hypothetical protein